MSHFSSIGFDVSSLDEILALAKRVEPSASQIRVGVGEYRRWIGGSGEELWLSINSAQQVVDVSPHFSGESDVLVRLTSRLQRADGSPLEGSFYSEADPGDEEDSWTYRFVFDCPEFAVLASTRLPHTARFQIAAFAHEATFHVSPEEYETAQASQIPKFAIQSFFPIGLFREEGAAGPPEALATFTGMVSAGGARTNSLTGLPFHWALVDTLGGRYDVVIDPKLLPDPPSVGGVLTVTGWLSGRCISEPKRNRGWLSKLFGSPKGS